MATTGPAERELSRVALRYAVAIRTLVVVVSAMVSLVTTAPRQPVLGPVVILAFVAWSLLYAYGSLKRRWRWVEPADVIVVVGVCLAQVWTAVPEMRADRVSWVLAAVSIIVVAYQFHSSVTAGVVVTVVEVAAYLTGAVLADVQDWTFA
ncbi:hypothetical protein ACFQ1S_06960, partial [Kibdelosporangium lantanae]